MTARPAPESASVPRFADGLNAPSDDLADYRMPDAPADYALGVGDIVSFKGTVFDVEAQVVRIDAASAYTEAQYWLHGRGEWAALTWLHGTRDQLEIVLTAEAWKAGNGVVGEAPTSEPIGV